MKNRNALNNQQSLTTEIKEINPSSQPISTTKSAQKRKYRTKVDFNSIKIEKKSDTKIKLVNFGKNTSAQVERALRGVIDRLFKEYKHLITISSAKPDNVALKLKKNQLLPNGESLESFYLRLRNEISLNQPETKRRKISHQSTHHPRSISYNPEPRTAEEKPCTTISYGHYTNDRFDVPQTLDPALLLTSDNLPNIPSTENVPYIPGLLPKQSFLAQENKNLQNSNDANTELDNFFKEIEDDLFQFNI